MRFERVLSESVSVPGYYKAVIMGYESITLKEYGDYYRVDFVVNDAGKDVVVQGLYKAHDVVRPSAKLWELFEAVYPDEDLTKSLHEMDDIVNAHVIVNLQNVLSKGNTITIVKNVLPESAKVTTMDEVPSTW